MGIRAEHPRHRDRARGNMIIGGLLIGFVALVFAITVVKLATGAEERAQTQTMPAAADSAEEGQ